MFGRKTRTLHQEHAAAHAVAQGALGVFRGLADDLRSAADQHLKVADAAHQEVINMINLRDSADEAAAVNLNQANAIEGLLSGSFTPSSVTADQAAATQLTEVAE